TKYLDATIDIHSGGIDLVFPHHENEIAEAEACSGQTFARYWLHIEHLIVFGKKMSKSLGNFFTLRQVIRKGYDPRAIRLLYLKTHYRSKLDFDFEKLEKAQEEIKLIEGLVKDLESMKIYGDNAYDSKVEDFKKGFSKHMGDDLRTDEAWLLFLGFLREVKKEMERGVLSKDGARDIKKAVDWVDSIFGVQGECKLTP
ncbi:MAG: cysteine--tRNA ligase, partial [Candidatus Hydrothermarchaeales archaeon]